MIFSMTGFAAVAAERDAGSFALELRAVNHRYLDIQFRLPDQLSMLEPQLREAIASQLTRGKVECRVSHAPRQSAQNPAPLNPVMLRQLVQWSAEVKQALPEAGGLSVADVLRWNGVLQGTLLSADVLREVVLEMVQQALHDFTQARAREGAKLKEFLLQRVVQIQELAVVVAPRIPAAITAYEEKLTARLQAVMQGCDDERIRQEISLYATKIDVGEELSRLQTHLAEVERVLAQGGTAGKRLDFLVQELHREANTLGAKSVDAEVSHVSMEMKLLIEQMREQIQNIE